MGYRLFNKNKVANHYEAGEIHSICIVQPGHIGDLLLSLPMIEKLRKNFMGKISLAVSNYTYELAENLSIVDEILSLEHFRSIYLYNSKKKSLFKAIKAFKRINSDVIFELRGDINLIIPLFLFSKYKHLIGFNVGGGGFLLDTTLEYPHHEHISETFYRFLDFLDIKKPALKKLDCYLKKPLENKLNDENYITLSIGAGAQSKEWEDEKFIKLINLILSDGMKVVIIGKISKDRAELYNLLKHKNLINFLNKTSIVDALSIIKYSRAFVGLDSGMTHAAAMLGINTIALYSAVTEVNVWRPFNELSKPRPRAP
ncbi:MAG: glycosyltransferase family 9 protein [Candidatus Micrarchaeaceae archaeon]